MGPSRRWRDGEQGALSSAVVDELRDELPSVARLALEAIVDEVPEYARTLDTDVAPTIEAAIVAALGAFLRVLEHQEGPGGRDVPLDAARAGAYDLGRGEARVGRTADALLAAYRIGARVSWREMSASVVALGTPADDVAHFAGLVFAYIDELSASSVAGHSDELATSGRLREERRQRLAHGLLTGAPTEALVELAARADWQPPTTLTAVLLPSPQAHERLPRLGSDTLSLSVDALGDVHAAEDHVVLLVPDATRTRGHLLQTVGGEAVVGPARPWMRAAGSMQVALRAHRLLGRSRDEALDTIERLATLTVGADPDTLDDLRRRALAPLDELTSAARDRLTETLRAWLLHLGRRKDVAEQLHVHPQTVRYRMDQLRDLYGDGLTDPGTVEELVVALALTPR